MSHEISFIDTLYCHPELVYPSPILNNYNYSYKIPDNILLNARRNLIGRLSKKLIKYNIHYIHGALLKDNDNSNFAILSPSGGGKSILSYKIIKKGMRLCDDDSFWVDIKNGVVLTQGLSRIVVIRDRTSDTDNNSTKAEKLIFISTRSRSYTPSRLKAIFFLLPQSNIKYSIQKIESISSKISSLLWQSILCYENTDWINNFVEMAKFMVKKIPVYTVKLPLLSMVGADIEIASDLILREIKKIR